MPDLTGEFERNGYVVLPDGVTPRALDLLERHSQELWDSGAAIQPAGKQAWSQVVGQKLPADLAARDIFAQHARVVLRRLLGVPDALLLATLSLQYAYAVRTPPGARSLTSHIDGMMPDGRCVRIKGLIGVLLHDMPTEDGGNLRIRPGSHCLTRKFLTTHADLPASEAIIRYNANIEADSEGYDALRGARGTLILCDPLLHHHVGPNNTDTVRRMLYLRVDPRGVNFRRGGQPVEPEPRAGSLLLAEPGWRHRAWNMRLNSLRNAATQLITPRT